MDGSLVETNDGYPFSEWFVSMHDIIGAAVSSAGDGCTGSVGASWESHWG